MKCNMLYEFVCVEIASGGDHSAACYWRLGAYTECNDKKYDRKRPAGSTQPRSEHARALAHIIHTCYTHRIVSTTQKHANDGHHIFG